MSEKDTQFANRFLAAACRRFVRYDQRRRELEQAIDRELVNRDRWTNLFIAAYGLGFVGLLAFLAARAETLPWYPVIPAFFYVLCAVFVAGAVVVHICVALRGRYGERDRAVKADWGAWCVVAMAVPLLIWWFIHPGVSHKTYLAVVAVGAVVLAVAESQRRQTRLLQQNMREMLLETELRLAKLIELAANRPLTSDRPREQETKESHSK